MKNVLIIVLIILIIGGTSYAVYYQVDKFNKKTNTEVNDENRINQDVESKQNKNLLSEQDALTVGNELWNYAYDIVWCDKFEETNGILTNYEQLHAKFSNDFIGEKAITNSKEKFDEFYGLEKNSDNTYSILACGRGGLTITYMGTELSIKNNTENEITFKAISNFCDENVLQETNQCSKVANAIEKDFIIEKVNNNWVIKYFYLPN